MHGERMKYPKLIYSNFSSTVTDFNSVIRSLWIGLAGFVLIVIGSYDSNSGFGDRISLETFITYITIATLFSLNYLLQNHKNLKIAFSLIVLVSLLFDIWLSIFTYEKYGYHFVTAVSLVAYSFVLLAIALVQKSKSG